jgi:nucleoside diphosphate kinase
MTDDISLLLVKPECITKRDKIEANISLRGYKILETFLLGNFSNKIRQIYRIQVNGKGLQDDFVTFIGDAYDSSEFGNEFIVYLLSHNEGNTIERLIRDTGHRSNYQRVKENTLRGLFGYSEKYNLPYKENTLYFNGFHKTDSISDIAEHLNILELMKKNDSKKVNL